VVTGSGTIASFGRCSAKFWAIDKWLSSVAMSPTVSRATAKPVLLLRRMKSKESFNPAIDDQLVAAITSARYGKVNRIDVGFCALAHRVIEAKLLRFGRRYP
jgi:hypothetical protein